MTNNITNDPPVIECQKCKKDLRHGGHKLFGTNQRGDIKHNLLKALAQKKEDHIFYRKTNIRLIDEIKKRYSKKEINAKRQLYLIVPENIQGHHLIPIEVVKPPGEKFKNRWFELFYEYGYDINCAQNGVLLPGDMLVACHFKVPFHRGGHGATTTWFDKKEFSIKKNYVNKAKNMVKYLMRDYKSTECKPIKASKIKKFHKILLDKSEYIFKRVINFDWLITSDGMHYHESSKIGCYNKCRSIAEKRNSMAKDLNEKKKKDEKVVDYTIKLIRVFEKNGAQGCPNKRNHIYNGCIGNKVDWYTECRYNEMNEEIEGLEDK